MENNTLSSVSPSIVSETTDIYVFSFTGVWLVILIQAIVGVYAFVALLRYECLLRNVSKKHSRKLKRLRWCVLFGSTGILIFYALTFVLPFVTIYNPTPSRCQTLLVMEKLILSTVVFSNYFFLWLRQKNFYSNPSLEHLYNKTFRAVSWSAFGLIAVFYVCQIALTSIGPSFTIPLSNSNTTCIKTEIWLVETQIILSAFSSMATHSVLLCLFIYPLLRHRLETTDVLNQDNQRGVVEGGNDSTLSFKSRSIKNELKSSLKSTSIKKRTISSKGHGDSEKRLPLLIRRCFYLTASCVVVNLIATILTATLFRKEVKTVTMLYGFSLITNLFASIAFFSGWRNILFPNRWFKKSSTVIAKQRSSISKESVPI